MDRTLHACGASAVVLDAGPWDGQCVTAAGQARGAERCAEGRTDGRAPARGLRVLAWEAWAWKRHGAADGTGTRACDEQDVVCVVCLAALVLRP